MENTNNIPTGAATGQFNVNAMQWNEQEGVFVLSDGTKYRAVILYGNNRLDIKDLDNKEEVVKEIKKVFTESQFHFDDLDQVKISKHSLIQGNRVISLQEEQKNTISTLFSRVIPMLSRPMEEEGAIIPVENPQLLPVVTSPERFSNKLAFEKVQTLTEAEALDLEEAIRRSKMKSDQLERRETELKSCINRIESDWELKYQEIPGTGNCLFEAALIGLQRMGREESGVTVIQFREKVVTALRQQQLQVKNQIVEDLKELKKVATDQESLEKELALYQPPLRDTYLQIIKLAKPEITSFHDVMNILFVNHLEEVADSLVETYLETMRKEKTYGGTIELYAIQNLFNVPIYIFTESSGEYRGQILHQAYNEDNPKENLHLLFLGRHYDLFIPN